MTQIKKDARPEARLPKGFRDIGPAELAETQRMIATIRAVYEGYGFDALETPAFEYTEALGKFLPDQDRPNAGVFSVQDEDEQWMSLRYDLTAPLARYVAENFQTLPKPFRRYAYGPVWRNEKPGPGRFRQFTQFDADTVGAESVAADAEICMLAADTLERLGVKRGDYVVKVSHRKLLDGVMTAIGLGGEGDAARRLIVLRAIDKLDRLGIAGVTELLGKGRKDESGDFTKGADLDAGQISTVAGFLQRPPAEADAALAAVPAFAEALADLARIGEFTTASGFGPDRIRIDQTVVRGLEYYTGPVFEAELTFQVTGDDGSPVRFGSVGGGGRYDDLVARFTGQRVPATGFSIGVSRLQAALRLLKTGETTAGRGPVVVLVMDKDRVADYVAMTQSLRAAGIRAEMYLGSSGMKPQMKYADRRGAPCVVIQGSNEKAEGVVQIKDLIEGARLAGQFTDAREMREARPAQISVREADMVAGVRDILARHA
ncbi:MAG: histidine--tRNA ligase [Hyphomicrobiaceae bacterium]